MKNRKFISDTSIAIAKDMMERERIKLVSESTDSGISICADTWKSTQHISITAVIIHTQNIYVEDFG